MVLLNILPINGSDSTLNNNYTLGVRWNYLGHALLTIPLFTLLMLKFNTLQPLTSDAGGHLTRSVLQSFSQSPLQPLTRSILPFFKTSILLLILTSIIIAVILEGLQYFIPYRTFNVNDIVAGGIGVVVGMMFVNSKIVRNTQLT